MTEDTDIQKVFPLRRIALIAAICIAIAVFGFTIYRYVDFPLSESRQEINFPDSHSFVLENGLQLVVIPNDKVPAVAHLVLYRAGSIDEPVGKSGISHMLEHMMFKETGELAVGEFSEIIAREGGEDNAFTSSDLTGYYQNISKEKLDLVMRMEADRMHRLVLTEEEFVKENNVVLEERNLRVDNKPAAVLREQMRAALFLNHPYGRPVIGWKHEIERLTLDDAKAFYKQYYSPENAIVVVSGDVVASEVLALTKQHYGAIPSRPSPVERTALPEEPEHQSARAVFHKDEKVNVPTWYRSYLAPGINDHDIRDIFALITLDHILAGTDTSRLYQSMVVNNGIALSISSSYDYLNRGSGIFSISATPIEGVSFETIENMIEAHITEIKQKGITIEELERAKTALIASEIYARESLKHLAFLYGSFYAIAGDATLLDNWSGYIKKVTIDDVIKASNKVFNSKQSVTGYLEKETEVKESVQ